MATNICKMTTKIYVLITKEGVEVYKNLKHLTDNNHKVSYFKAYRALLKKGSYFTEDYSITECVLKYKTNRRIPTK